MEEKKELEEVNNKDLDDETLFVVSQTFKALGDPLREFGFSICSFIRSIR